ncbi:general transcription repressor [Blyttiomyces sp. JEL0837]|nr:general transcription repressor [Blyttiomyces sp. JEL0837]
MPSQQQGPQHYQPPPPSHHGSNLRPQQQPSLAPMQGGGGMPPMMTGPPPPPHNMPPGPGQQSSFPPLPHQQQGPPPPLLQQQQHQGPMGSIPPPLSGPPGLQQQPPPPPQHAVGTPAPLMSGSSSSSLNIPPTASGPPHGGPGVAIPLPLPMPPPPPPHPSLTRIPELFDSIRHEFELFCSQEVNVAKAQRDEVEQAYAGQFNEMNQFRQFLFELERAHAKVKMGFEEEVARLRGEVERVVNSGGGGSGAGAGVVASQQQPGPPPNQQQQQMLGQGGPVAGPDGDGYHNGAGPGGNIEHVPKRLRGKDGPVYPGGPPGAPPPGGSPSQQSQQQQGGLPVPKKSGSVGGGGVKQEDYRQSPHLTHSPPELKRKIAGSGGSNTPSANMGGLGGMTPPMQQQQQQQQHQQQPPPQTYPVPVPRHVAQQQQPVTGVADLDNVEAQWRREGSDWIARSNPRSVVGNGIVARGGGAVVSGMLSVDLMHSFDHGSVVCCVKFSLDGALLATGCNRTVQVFDVRTGVKTHTLVAVGAGPEYGNDGSGAPGGGPDLYIRSVCFSPDGRFLAAGAEDRIVRVWELLGGNSNGNGNGNSSLRYSLQGHEQDIYSLDWSVDGRVLVSGAGDRTVRVWDLASGGCARLIVNDDDGEHPGGPNGGLGGGPGGVGKDAAGVTSLAICPVDGGSCVVTGSLDRQVRLWDLRTGRLLERFEGHRDSVYSVAFSPDGGSIVSGSLDKTLKVWDLSPATLSILSRPPPGDPGLLHQQPVTVNVGPRQTFAGHKDFVLSVGFAGVGSGFGASVASNGSGGGNGAASEPGGVDPAVAGLLAEAYRDVEFVVSASKDRTVTFWDARSGAGIGVGGKDVNASPQFVLRGHLNSVISIALSSNHGIFATGSGDMKARVWRVFAMRV